MPGAESSPRSAVAVADELSRLLFHDRRLAAGYSVERVECSRMFEITLGDGTRRFTVWLEPAIAGGPSYRATRLFLVGHEGDLPDGGRLALDALVDRLRARERTIPELTYARFFLETSGPRYHPAMPPLEWLAVLAGLRPACRQVVSRAILPTAQSLARDLGLTVLAQPVADERFQARLEGDTLLFVAQSPAQAQTVAETDLVLLPGTSDERARETVRAQGEALGYPACCIERFQAHHTEPNDALRRLALAATPPGRFEPLLNNLDFRWSLVSHFVCRYDCGPSLAYARALHAQVRARSPAIAKAIERFLVLTTERLFTLEG